MAMDVITGEVKLGYDYVLLYNVWFNDGKSLDLYQAYIEDQVIRYYKNGTLVHENSLTKKLQ